MSASNSTSNSNSSSSDDVDAVPESPYSSTSEVSLAVENYFASGGGGGSGSGSGSGSGWGSGSGSGAFGDIGESATLSGSLSAPSEISSAAGFTATCQISNDGDAINGQIILAVAPAEGSPYRLGSAQAAIDAGGSGTVEIEVPRGAIPATPGDATLGAISAASADSTGVIATTATRILSEDEQGTPEERMNGWSEPEYVRSLPAGWHLYVQYKGENQQQQRFRVSAKDQSGELLYLARDGSVSRQPTYFDTLDAVASALSAYQQNVENGSVGEGDRPDSSQTRPSSGELTDSIASSGGGVGGSLLGGVNSSTLAIGGMLAVAGYVYYRRQGGEIDLPDLPNSIEELSRNQKYALAGGGLLAVYLWSSGAL